MAIQQLLPLDGTPPRAKPFRTQLLKWVGNKQRFAHEIISNFPKRFGCYFEPFLGSGAVLGSLAPQRAVGSDAFGPLAEIWQTLHRDPALLKAWYAERWELIQRTTNEQAYELVKADFNRKPNAADLLYLCRSCYGGVVRFRKADGYMSTPCGAHRPIHPRSFAKRVDVWNDRCRHVEFVHCDYKEMLQTARPGDLVYCDPPYVDSQAILYGAQSFSIRELLQQIADSADRGVFVALSIDGSKRSGGKLCDVPIPEGLFRVEAFVNCGRSMLRRFQMGGQTLESEVVSDRLLLTYNPDVD
jgi:DNA adenine methylase